MNLFALLKLKKVTLGDLPIWDFTIIEYKPWFSVKIFLFMKGQAQDRFHTHSFNSYSFRLFGNYVERIIPDDNHPEETIKINRNSKRLINIPKDRFHSITESEGCCTIVVTGPWGKSFKELKEGIVSHLTYKRKPLV